MVSKFLESLAIKKKKENERSETALITVIVLHVEL